MYMYLIMVHVYINYLGCKEQKYVHHTIMNGEIHFYPSNLSLCQFQFSKCHNWFVWYTLYVYGTKISLIRCVKFTLTIICSSDFQIYHAEFDTASSYKCNDRIPLVAQFGVHSFKLLNNFAYKKRVRSIFPHILTNCFVTDIYVFNLKGAAMFAVFQPYNDEFDWLNEIWLSNQIKCLITISRIDNSSLNIFRNLNFLAIGQ